MLVLSAPVAVACPFFSSQHTGLAVGVQPKAKVEHTAELCVMEEKEPFGDQEDGIGERLSDFGWERHISQRCCFNAGWHDDHLR